MDLELILEWVKTLEDVGMEGMYFIYKKDKSFGGQRMGCSELNGVPSEFICMKDLRMWLYLEIGSSKI